MFARSAFGCFTPVITGNSLESFMHLIPKYGSSLPTMASQMGQNNGKHNGQAETKGSNVLG
jgi:hypothetical protein